MEPVNTEALKRALHTRLCGQELEYVAEVDSTNAALSRRAKAGAVEGTVVLADAQTAGRGRLGKPWFSPPGVNVHLSVLLKPPVQLAEVRLLSLIGSLAVADALATYSISAQVKWPNDVLVADRKIAGVLTEVQTHDTTVTHLILGIGVNVNIDRPTMERVFGEAAAGATSVRDVLGKDVDRATFIALLLEKLERRYFDFLTHGKQELLKEWRSRSFLGRRVSVREEDMHVEGVALDLDEDGCLLVTLDDGSSVRVREGEVQPLAHEPTR